MEEFKTFLDQNGFSLRKSSAGGSHRVYQIPISGIRKNVTITCPHGSKNGIPEYQIKLVLALIDEKKEELK